MKNVNVQALAISNEKSIKLDADRSAIDSIRDYIFSLPEWDGVDHIGTFLQQIKLANENIRPLLTRYFEEWVTAYVGSLVDLRIINETCLVLAGKQGIGKNRFFERLIPPHLRHQCIYTGFFNIKSTDLLEMLNTKIMILVDELSVRNRNDIASLKIALPLRSVVLRRAYCRSALPLTRYASFCGCSNDVKFRLSQTDNSRIHVFQIQDINIDRHFDIGLLYAQALALFKDISNTLNNIRTTTEGK